MLRLRHLLRKPPARTSLLRLAPPRRAVSEYSNVRHVRFQRPWFRSFFSKLLLYGTALYLWHSFVLARFDDDSLDTDSNTPRGDDSADEEAEDEGPLFIPLSWARLQQGDLYTVKDPEWQEFVKISKDRKQLQNLRDELASIVLDTASDGIAPILGSPLSITGFWLVHQFPSRAPPTYTQSGLEITDDGISWISNKPMEPDVGDRLQKFMNPFHVALAIKDTYMVLAKRQLDRFRNSEGQSVDALEFMNQKPPPPGSERLDEVSQLEQPKLRPPTPEGLGGNAASDSESTEYHSSSIISSLQRLPLPDLGPGSDLHLASMAFRLRLKEYQARAPRTPRRGTFFISGPVGLKGPHGFCRFEVRGEYDPVKSGWRTVEMKLKDVNLRRQRALGGR